MTKRTHIRAVIKENMVVYDQKNTYQSYNQRKNGGIVYDQKHTSEL